MESKLYVGNLAYTATEDNLKVLFSQAGEVKSVAIIKDRETGRSKGFGFIEMSTEAEAQKAITMFHNFAYKERNLTVNIARPKEDSPRSSGQRYNSSGSSGYNSRGKEGSNKGGQRRY